MLPPPRPPPPLGPPRRRHLLPPHTAPPPPRRSPSSPPLPLPRRRAAPGNPSAPARPDLAEGAGMPAEPRRRGGRIPSADRADKGVSPRGSSVGRGRRGDYFPQRRRDLGGEGFCGRWWRYGQR